MFNFHNISSVKIREFLLIGCNLVKRGVSIVKKMQIYVYKEWYEVKKMIIIFR